MNKNLAPDPDLIGRLETLRSKISEEQKQSIEKAKTDGASSYQQKTDELLDHLTKIARDVSRRRYGDPEEIFELTKTSVYPERIYELAESFGMMIVKVEARELRLEQTIEKLKILNDQLRQECDKRSKIEEELKLHRDDLEKLILERTDELMKANEMLKIEILERQEIDEDRKKLVDDLQEALDNIKTLKGLIPICSSCKNIRDDKGYWNDLETYIMTNTGIQFSYSLCPDCMEKYYPDEFKRLKEKGKIG